jgi:hypothetical protein
MPRAKKHVAASRRNGACTSNKGLAKSTMKVLTIAERDGLNIVVEEQRAKLPKGYKFYASEHAVRRRLLDAVELRKELKEAPAADKKILEQGFGMSAENAEKLIASYLACSSAAKPSA